MKSYKLVNSRGIREKAKRMGYSCINNVDVCFLFLSKSGAITTKTNDWSYYTCHTYQEITQADFLALPEPLKVGDWFFHFKSENSVEIKKVFKIDGQRIYLDQVVSCHSNSSRKLTPKQIEVLEL